MVNKFQSVSSLVSSLSRSMFVVALGIVTISGCSEKAKEPQAGEAAPQPNNNPAATTGASSSSAPSQAEDNTQDDQPEEPQPGSVELGDDCQADAHCKSGICKELYYPGEPDSTEPRPKTCAECRDDAQCIAEKKGIVCTASMEEGFIRCQDGSLGTPCEKKEHCSGNLGCFKVKLGDNESFMKSCSECGSHSDCPAEGNRNCVARDSSENLAYFNRCLADGARKTGEACFPCETGDRECAGGFCVKVKNEDPEDTFCVGVCGECRADTDCKEGFRCTPAKLADFEKDFAIDGHEYSRCVKKG